MAMVSRNVLERGTNKLLGRPTTESGRFKQSVAVVLEHSESTTGPFLAGTKESRSRMVVVRSAVSQHDFSQRFSERPF